MCYYFDMEQPPNMKDYRKEYAEFSLNVPERFSFPLDVLDKWAASMPDEPALFWTDGAVEKKSSFSELKVLSSKGAGALKKTGIQKGDKVLVMLPNIPEWWEIMLALMRLNAIPDGQRRHGRAFSDRGTWERQFSPSIKKESSSRRQ